MNRPRAGIASTTTGGPVPDFAAQIDHPGLRDFYAHWLAKRGGKRVPARADIDPVEIHRFLPNIFMMDVIDGGRRFRYRLVGTAVGNALGDYSGRYVDEALPPAQYAIYHVKYQRVVHELAMIYEAVRVFWQDGPPVVFRRLMLPLSDDQITANILFGLGYYDYGGRKPPPGRRVDAVVRVEQVSEVVAAPPAVGPAAGPAQGASGGS
jgi:hypothetical protein